MVDALASVVNNRFTSQHQEIKSREIVSSAALQLFLFFNVFFSIVHFIVFVFLLRWRVLNDNNFVFNEIVNPLAFGLWSIIEIYRLYLGYTGNLQEKVSYLAAFWFISIFPQFLLQIYFMKLQKPLLPIDEVHAYITMFFLIVELILGYRAIGRIIRNKTARFAVEYGDTEVGEEDEERLLANRGIGSEGPAKAGSYTARSMDTRVTSTLPRPRTRNNHSGYDESGIELTTTSGRYPPSPSSSRGYRETPRTARTATTRTPRTARTPRTPRHPKIE